jgi:hypothetical protein
MLTKAWSRNLDKNAFISRNSPTLDMGTAINKNIVMLLALSLILLLRRSQPKRQYLKVASVILMLALLLVSFIVIEVIIYEQASMWDLV